MIVLFQLGVAMLGGMLMSRVAKRLQLPAVTAYLVAGLLLGPFLLGRLGIEGFGFNTLEQVDHLDVISNVALGFIAFSMGNEFRMSALKKTGKQAAVVALIQALTATVLVDLVLVAVHFLMPEKLPISVCITLGAIATATAPAATLMVVNQYKAKGPVTDILLPVVALDDAIGLIVFAISFGIAKALEGGGTVNAVTVAVNPLLEIVLSLAMGSVMSLLLTFLERFFHSRSNRMCISITFVFLTVALSLMEFSIPGTDIVIGFSSLLACMMLGTIFCNICDFSEELMAKVERWTAPLYLLFFVLSGAELNLSVFADIAVVGVGLLYILSRSAGKMLGASVGSRLMHCDPNVQKYLGITLLPQAGVALGMTVTVAEELGQSGTIIRSITLFAVLIYELVGPMLTKIALTKAGDIQPEGRTSSRGVMN